MASANACGTAKKFLGAWLKATPANGAPTYNGLFTTNTTGQAKPRSVTLKGILAPGQYHFTAARILDDARIAVAVGNEKVAVGQHSDRRWLAESRLAVARLKGEAERQRGLGPVVRAKLHHLVQRNVRDPHIVVVVDVQPVRHIKHPVAPLVGDAAGAAIERDDRFVGNRAPVPGHVDVRQAECRRIPNVIAPMEHHHVAVVVEADGAHAA